MVRPTAPPNVIIEDAVIPGFMRNFEGKQKKYNKPGDRNFCVMLSDDLVEPLQRDGWNVKFLKPRDPEDSPAPYLQVAVGYKIKPPKVVIITSKGRTDLSEEEVILLDWADMAKADLIIRPYPYDVDGNVGIKAYLKSLFVTIQEDYLELKYSDVPEAQVPLAIEGDDGVIDVEWFEEEQLKALEAPKS